MSGFSCLPLISSTAQFNSSGHLLAYRSSIKEVADEGQ